MNISAELTNTLFCAGFLQTGDIFVTLFVSLPNADLTDLEVGQAHHDFSHAVLLAGALAYQ